MVPKMLTADPKEIRVTRTAELIGMANTDTAFVLIAVTGYKTWCFREHQQLQHKQLFKQNFRHLNRKQKHLQSRTDVAWTKEREK